MHVRKAKDREYNSTNSLTYTNVIRQFVHLQVYGDTQ